MQCILYPEVSIFHTGRVFCLLFRQSALYREEISRKKELTVISEIIRGLGLRIQITLKNFIAHACELL